MTSPLRVLTTNLRQLGRVGYKYDATITMTSLGTLRITSTEDDHDENDNIQTDSLLQFLSILSQMTRDGMRYSIDITLPNGTGNVHIEN
jgi:hypothetical protein